ncbi:MAG: UPF0149 family protein [Pseudomonadota bacterium]
MVASNFSRLEDTLCEASATMGAAECDGALYGSLISAGEASRENWLSEVLGANGFGGAGIERCWRMLEESWQAAAELIESESYNFTPLLPSTMSRCRLEPAHWASGAAASCLVLVSGASMTFITSRPKRRR